MMRPASCVIVWLLGAVQLVAAGESTTSRFGVPTPALEWVSSPLSWTAEAESVSRIPDASAVFSRPVRGAELSIRGQSAAGTDPETWSVFAPYAWGMSAKGAITIRGNRQSLDSSLSDLIDLIKDGDLRGAGMVHMETGSGNFGVLVDGVISSLGVTENVSPLVTANLQFDLTMLETMGILRVWDTTTADDSSIPIVVDVLGGLRYYDVGAELRLAIGGFLTPDLGQSNNWVDLTTGVRTRIALTEYLFGSVRFDVGGFGLGTSSDMAYNLTTGLEYYCPTYEGLSLFLGYRYLDIDENHSTGTPEAFGFDATLHGPVMGLVLRF